MPAIMGIVNVTPDSFSDGGKHFSPARAIDHALRLEDEGAEILDIGGESTRPYSDQIATDEELRRVMPVIEGLIERVAVPISIDTSKAAVARAAIDVGVEIVNDVSGLEGDPDMPQLVLEAQVGVCVMHMQGTPQTMQDAPQYQDVVADILAYLRARDLMLLEMGIAADRICLDPGIGFGKTFEHNIALLQQAEQFLGLGRPILIGHSRKGFIGKLVGGKSTERIGGSVGVSIAMATKGIQILRVHDVQQTRDAILCFSACK